MMPRIFTSWLIKLFDGIESKAHYKLANALMKQGALKAAIASYNSARLLSRNHPQSQNNLSMAELLAGNYKSGWERYEYRL